MGSETKRLVANYAARDLGFEVGVTAYVIFRVVRMLPSLAPPLGETIPLNAALP
jgi:hypothetical protein